MLKHNKSRLSELLLIADITSLLALLEIFHYMRQGVLFSPWAWPVAIVIFTVVVTMYIFDVYRIEIPVTKSRLVLQTILSVVVAGLIISGIIYSIGRDTHIPLFGRGILPISLTVFAGVAAWIRYFLSRKYEQKYLNSNWLCLADVNQLSYFLAEFSDKQQYGNVSVLSEIEPEGRLKSPPINWLGTLNGDNEETITKTNWAGIITATHAPLSDKMVHVLLQKKFKGTPLYSLSEYVEKFWLKVPVLQIKDSWFIQSSGFNLVHDTLGINFKRMVDIGLSLISIIALLPLVIFISILIRSTSRGTSLFRQDRVGLNGKIFTLYKFRTMSNSTDDDSATWTKIDDPRITKVGQTLRKTRLDELPQIWNVLKGEMSFVGPRPERPEFVSMLEKEIPYYELRHLVTPGISGWAQVMYPYGASIEDAIKKLEYDLYYIKNHSVTLDLAIFLKTIRVIFHAKGR